MSDNINKPLKNLLRKHLIPSLSIDKKASLGPYGLLFVMHFIKKKVMKKCGYAFYVVENLPENNDRAYFAMFYQELTRNTSSCLKSTISIL